MTDRCIHGFEPQTCASCRRCVHGLAESRCGVCVPRTAREATLMLANDQPRPPEEHRGYQILYVAGQRSWFTRPDPDAPLSAESYRSSFLARRAIDRMIDAPPSAPAKGRRTT
jgi:hypothetical protein